VPEGGAGCTSRIPYHLADVALIAQRLRRRGMKGNRRH
jgi:hypothetical protein